jgi:hypothetical protein
VSERPKVQTTFSLVSASLIGEKIKIRVKNDSEQAKTCYVRPLFEESDAYDFKPVTVEAQGEGHLEFDAPSEWTDTPGARFVFVEITLTQPPDSGSGRAFAPKELSTSRLVVQPEARPKGKY